MGNKNSRSVDLPKHESNDNGQAQVRAIAKGRLYVILHYPREADEREGTEFTDESFKELLSELQKVSLNVSLQCQRICSLRL